jgi:hypothetical protein
MHISYKAILDITFDNFLLLMLFHPSSLILLNIPVNVSSIMALATDINNPDIGTNSNTYDATI